MDRYPGYESMLARVEQKKVQVKGQLPTFYSHLVDNMVAFVLDQVNECCNVPMTDATTDTAEDQLLPGSNGPVARAFADDTRVDVSEHVNTVNPQVNHQCQAASGSISNEQSVSPPSPPSVTQSTIPANIEVKVEYESNGQSVQLCEWIKKEEDEDDYEAQLFHCCDCGGEGCEECKVKLEMKEFDQSGETEQMEDCVKREIKEEFDESGFETELGGNSSQVVQGCTLVKKEEEDSEGERPKKMRRIYRVIGNVPNGSPSPVSTNVVPFNVECTDDQMATLSTNSLTIEGNQTFSDDLSGQSVQHFKCVKKEEDGGEYVMECDCEDCETCRVKMEMKEELDESGFETELGGNSGETGQGCTRVKKEEGEDDDEVKMPYKIRRMDRGVGNVSMGSPSPSSNVISMNVHEYVDDQMATSSTNSITIQDHTQPSQPVTVPFPTSIVSQSSSSTQHFNETLRDELLNAEPMMMDNVALVVYVRAGEFDREQIDEDNSTLNQVHTEQEDETEVDDNKNDGEQDEGDEGDETIEQREDTNAGDGQQVPAENFLKRIEPADELGNRFECDYQGCGKRMKHRSNTIRHIRSHTGEKLFMCSVEGCDREFIQKAKLKDHLNTHSGTRPFVCSWPRCEARFAQNRDLTAHLRNHTGERPFSCDQCRAAFTRHGDLVTHLRTHTGARPFVCTWPECGQAFTQSSNLKKHSTVHSNERQFVCDVTGCTKVYKHKDALRRHQKDKHN